MTAGWMDAGMKTAELKSDYSEAVMKIIENY